MFSVLLRSNRIRSNFKSFPFMKFFLVFTFNVFRLFFYVNAFDSILIFKRQLEKWNFPRFFVSFSCLLFRFLCASAVDEFDYSCIFIAQKLKYNTKHSQLHLKNCSVLSVHFISIFAVISSSYALYFLWLCQFVCPFQLLTHYTMPQVWSI